MRLKNETKIVTSVDRVTSITADTYIITNCATDETALVVVDREEEEDALPVAALSFMTAYYYNTSISCGIVLYLVVFLVPGISTSSP